MSSGAPADRFAITRAIRKIIHPPRIFEKSCFSRFFRFWGFHFCRVLEDDFHFDLRSPPSLISRWNSAIMFLEPSYDFYSCLWILRRCYSRCQMLMNYSKWASSELRQSYAKSFRIWSFQRDYFFFWFFYSKIFPELGAIEILISTPASWTCRRKISVR